MSQSLILILFLGVVMLVESSSLSFIMILIVAHVLLLCYSSHLPGASPLSSFLLFCLLHIVLVFFSTTSVVIFFLSYEISLIPITIFILLLGYQPEKIQATSYLITYIILFSLPLFYYVALVGGRVHYLGSSASFSLDLLISLAFLVKSPLYLFHAWLPKAHVEAPVLGSVLLSGIMLKLGGYGFLLLSTSFGVVPMVFKFLSLTGGVVCGILCFRHHDAKTVVAYSSVVHIGSVTIGVLLCREAGYWVAVAIMVSHSFISPYLFLLANELYLCFNSRSFAHAFNTSITASYFFLLSLFWGLNFGVPPFLPF